MKKVGIIVVIVIAMFALVGSFVGVTAALDITQPAATNSNTTVNFTVKPGDTTASVASHLQQDGLIRNAELFRLWAKYRHLDTGIEPGVYQLTPSMTMDSIIKKLQLGKPDQQLATVPDGLRVTQYPQYFTALTNFSAQNFLQAAKTGTLSDGTQLWQKYWFVEKPGPKVAYALEGYLYPDTYYFNSSATDTDVIERMLTAFAEQLCPGPTGQPDAYIGDNATCKAHAATVGNGVNIFTSMEQAYFTTNDTQAIYYALTVASLTTREINHYSDAPGVASVYHNRFLEFEHKLPSGMNGGTAGYMGADPTVQYARDTDNPPSDGKWWTNLNDQGSKIHCTNPYNTESGCTQGLPPGPIAAPIDTVFAAAAAPKDPTSWPNFYFVNDKCGKTFYYPTYAAFVAHNAADQNSTAC